MNPRSDLWRKAVNIYKDQLIHAIGEKLVRDVGAGASDWAYLRLFGRMERNAPDMSGFAYTREGNSTPVAPRDFSVFDLLVELQDVMAAEERKMPWCAYLICIDRDSLRIEFEFEYRDMNRWAVTPKNLAERVRELNPVTK